MLRIDILTHTQVSRLQQDKSENEELHAKCQSLRTTLHESESREDALRIEIARIRRALSEAEARTESMQSESARKLRENEASRREVDALKLSGNFMLSEKSDLTRELARVRAECDALRGEASALRTLHTRYQDDMEQQRQEKLRAEECAAMLRNEKTCLEQRLATCSQTVTNRDTATSCVEEILGDMHKVRIKLKQMVSENAYMRAELEGWRPQYGGDAAEFSGMLARNSQLQLMRGPEQNLLKQSADLNGEVGETVSNSAHAHVFQHSHMHMLKRDHSQGLPMPMLQHLESDQNGMPQYDQNSRNAHAGAGHYTRQVLECQMSQRVLRQCEGDAASVQQYVVQTMSGWPYLQSTQQQHSDASNHVIRDSDTDNDRHGSDSYADNDKRHHDLRHGGGGVTKLAAADVTQTESAVVKGEEGKAKPRRRLFGILPF